MKRLLVIILFLFTPLIFAHIPAKMDEVSNDLRLSLIVVVDRQNISYSGLLIDLAGDSLKVLVRNKETAFHLNNVLRVDFPNPRESYDWALTGFVAGLYAGHYFLFTQSEQEGNFRSEYDTNGWTYIFNLLAGIVSGGAGYMIENSGKEVTTFIFAGDIEKEKSRFRKFLKGEQDRGKFSILFQMGQTDPKFLDIRNNSTIPYYDPYNEVSGFNLLRKFQINFEMYRSLSVGLAFNSITEPFVNWYNGDYYTWGNNYGSQALEGTGYYIAFQYNPLYKLLPAQLFATIGVMAGIMNIDYSFSSVSYVSYPEQPVQEEYSFSKNSFSAGFYTSVGFYLSQIFSLSLSGDYLYVPGETKAIRDLNIEAQSFSTYCFGFSLGFHF